MRILLVEDNADHRELMRLALTEYDDTWQVEGVVSGEAALRRLVEGEAYDVVFLDYSLPGRDGLEVLEEIRRGEAPPSVVMVTGRGDEQVAVVAMKGGAYDYIVKGEGYLQRLPVVAQRAMEADRLAMERKRAEGALRESEERYRRLVELSPEMIAIHLNERFLYINPAGVRLLGAANSDELIGRSVVDFIHPDYLGIAKDRIRQIREEGKQVPRIEEKFIRLDGSIADVEVSVAPYPHQGQIAVLTVALDTTEQRQIKKEKEVIEEQFRQAQKMEAIGLLAGGFAHDFNNSLSVIKICTQLALSDLKEGDPLKGRIEMILGETNRSANLARQLLVFSRRQVKEMVVLDLNHLLRELDKMLHRVIGEDIKIVHVLAKDLGKVKVDPGQIAQAVLNLALNARDAMPKGGKLIVETANVKLDEVYSSTHSDVIPGRYVMFSVSDTGVGMTPEVRERVFEPFFTTKEKGKGTGLGLYTVYGIVKQSGGDICVYSEPGYGATFKIFLPQVDEPFQEVREEAEKKDLPRGDETILVVEDDEKVRAVTVEVLMKYGYRVLDAPNGAKAMLICENHKGPIHLVLTDVVMPEMSGGELGGKLSLLYPEMKVIYMSGYMENEIVHTGVLPEGVNFIQKPFTLEGLVTKIREVLTQTH
ncbi:MAG: response regulator [Deltaproteobacteria bacterium]|nr:response regulator [Deltaproteobacteria bacterium]